MQGSQPAELLCDFPLAFACAAALSYCASAFAFAFACDGTFTFALPAAVVLLLFHLLLHLGFLLGAPCQFPVVSSEAVSVLGAAAAVFLLCLCFGCCVCICL